MARLYLVDSRDTRGGHCSSQPPRRGIILLFVLALLALFSLITVTFVLVARQSKISSQNAATFERTGNTGQVGSQFEFALMQALRGTNSPMSAMGPHSLLEDMYGSDGVTGTIVNGQVQSDGSTAADNPLGSAAAPTYALNSQAQRFLVQIDVSSTAPLYMYPGAYNGRIVTALTGAAAGLSSRVIDSAPAFDTKANPVTVPAVNVGPTHLLSVISFGALLNVGDRVLINGGAFNGTGFGFGFPLTAPAAPPTLYLGAVTNNSDITFETNPGLPYALLPNPVFFKPNKTDPTLGASGITATVQPWYTDAAGPGGADESYDAIDYQNMLPALYVPDALGDTTSVFDVPVPLPSLHRPELVYYWMVKSGALTAAGFTTSTPMSTLSAANVATIYQHMEGDASASITGTAPGLLRKIMLRPWGGTPISDHPQFTGSNPGFSPISLGSLNDARRWDVDNDQDGVCDSIWVDLGAGVMTAADGRKYKPLYALLVVDEDSRLNANAQGSLAHIDFSVSPSAPIDVTAIRRAGNYVGAQTASGVFGLHPGTNGYLPMGQGYGPADVNLGFVFEGAAGASNLPAMRGEYGNLLAGSGLVEGRYGEWNDTSITQTRAPGYTEVVPSVTAGDWLDDYVRTFDMPYDYLTDVGLPASSGVPGVFGSYGSPADLNGNGALGLDVRGQPVYTGKVSGTLYRSGAGLGEWISSTQSDKLNDPYELNLAWGVRHKHYSPTTGLQCAIDSPFTPADLERLRRFSDIDASSLSSRMTSLAPNAFVNGSLGTSNPHLDAARRRNLVTTESWHTPVPNAILPNDLITGLLTYDDAMSVAPTGYTPELTATYGLLGSHAQVNSVANLTFSELVRRRLAQTGFNLNGYSTPFSQQYQNLALRQLLSWDLARGEQLDLNRPLGNGTDNNANLVIDEPSEAAAGEVIWNGTLLAGSTTPNVDHNNDGIIGLDGSATALPSLGDKSDGYARQLLARHLYVLAWTVVDPTQSGADTLTPMVDNSVTGGGLVVRRIIARRLAQWAVNMVDFRDRDSIMTPFEYDVHPFDDGNPGDPLDDDGIVWDVDDDPATDPSNGDTAITASDRGVVWGCERPELLITETGATHDRRAGDTDDETMGKVIGAAMGDDTDLDQTKRPGGALFVELYAPWGQTTAPAPELSVYDSTNNAWQVKLNAKTADGSPVWRMVVMNAGTINDFPEMNEWNGSVTTPNSAIERAVYFIPDPGTTPVNDHQKPYYRPSSATTDVLIPANTYLVVGPSDPSSTQTTLLNAATADAPQTAGLTFAMATPFDMTGGPTYPTSPPSMSAQIKIPASLIINTPRRLSISEPYPGDAKAATADAKYTAWDGGMHGPNDPIPTPDDIPWDDSWLPADGGLPPFNGTTTNTTDPSLGYRTIFLQRLADPTKNWNRSTNPYLSIDRMPVDLTIYNSETNHVPLTGFQVEPAPNQYRFGTRQRGKVEVTITGTTTFNIWSSYPCAQTTAAGVPVAANFSHTLGYLNDPKKLAVSPQGATVTTYPQRLVKGTPVDAGELQNPYDDTFIGDPSTPFPWLAWNNRPYISKHELLMVPATEPYEMLIRHSARHPGTGATLGSADKSPYLLAANSAGVRLDIMAGLQYGYVSPLLMSSWMTLPSHPYSLPNFHRLLEFVTVPSRFSGTESFLDPAGTTGDTVFRLNPPFNRVSALREPGKPNINTVTDIKVWQGIMNQLPDGSPLAAPSTVSWQKLVTSRRGYGPNAPATSLVIDPSLVSPQTSAATGSLPLPTFFTNPFRSYGGLYLVPIPELQTSNFATPPAIGTLAHAAVSGGVWQNEIDATLLRVDQNSFAGAHLPLLAQNPTVVTDVAPYADALANPYFHYQNIQKISNLVTTRSNVYSVWITVGYFEVTRVPVDPNKHPDGWQLGAEMGIDTGKVERHRAYYLIDRSLPVGFQRGEDTNVERSILLKRIIE